MTFTESVSTCFKKFNVRTGRAGRSEYWYFQLFYFLLALVFVGTVAIVFPDADDKAINAAARIFRFIFLIPSVCVLVRRLHDTNHSGWWFFIAFTVVGILYLFYLTLKEGDHGDNQYGADPNGRDNDSDLDSLLEKKDESEQLGGDSVI